MSACRDWSARITRQPTRSADEGADAVLEDNARSVVDAFRYDDRVLATEIWSEPDNEGGGTVATTPQKLRPTIGLYRPRGLWRGVASEAPSHLPESARASP